ncbi:MAG: hypothetical protein IJY20_01115 [Clostridia bacterium]|nr:hypothetical protein [Clostridia bacterium]
MDKARKYAYVVLLLLCVAVPIAFVVFLWQTPMMPQDLSSYDYFAVTAPDGAESVYQAGESAFDGAAAAFAQASAVKALPGELDDAVFLTTEWIRDGRAYAWRLYLLPAVGEGYLVDERGTPFRLSEEGVLFFLQSAFAAPLLIGDEPPALILAEREVPFSLCRWTYTITPSGAHAVSVSSGEYINEEGKSLSVDLSSFAPQFAEQPKKTIYKIYSLADEIMSSEELPDLAALPEGQYQLILVAEWQRGNTLVRAGYSFLLER